MWHLESLVVALELLVGACGICFPDQGLNPGPWHWEIRVLVTGPSGKSQIWLISRTIDLILLAHLNLWTESHTCHLKDSSYPSVENVLDSSDLRFLFT